MAEARGGVDDTLVALALGLFLLSAWAMDAAGIHAVFGGFLLGTAMPRGSAPATSTASGSASPATTKKAMRQPKA